MNAMKHGERSADRIAARRELRQALQELPECENEEASVIDTVALAQNWTGRVIDELRALMHG